MIKLFRNIRKNLLNEGKTNKYFKYAIGEIVLVVIGILIALAISDWNSNRLNANRNYTLLGKLSKELDLNIERSVFLDTVGFTEGGKYTDSILNILNRGVMVDDLDYLVKNSTFYETNLNLNTSVFEELKNTGSLYAIGSDSLVTTIQRYYQLCDRESFYSLTYGKELLHLKEKCYDGWWDFSSLYQIDPNNAIDIHSWVFNPRSPEYIHYRQFIEYYKFYNQVMTYKLNDIIGESKKLQKLITTELKHNQ
jgi:hypothetical protein